MLAWSPRIWGYLMAPRGRNWWRQAFTKFLTSIFMLRWRNCRRGKEGHGALTRWFISRDMESSIWLEVRSQFHRSFQICCASEISSESASGSQAGVLQGHVTFPNTLPLSDDSPVSYSSPQECQVYRHTPCTHLSGCVPQILGQQASMASAFTG